MEISSIIEWILIIGVFGMYFGMPFIAKEYENLDRRIKAIKVMNIIYLTFTIGLIGFIIYEFVGYELSSEYKMTRAALIVISIIMFCYSYFLKQKNWKK